MGFIGEFVVYRALLVYDWWTEVACAESFQRAVRDCACECLEIDWTLLEIERVCQDHEVRHRSQ